MHHQFGSGKGLTAEYPATSKLCPKLGGYAETEVHSGNTELSGYADTWIRTRFVAQYFSFLTAPNKKSEGD